MADQVYGAVPPDAVSVTGVTAVPTVPVLLPGLPTVTLPVPPPPDAKAALPFGVPRPVGPSQPGPAVHHTDGLHEPLLPVVTSNRFPVWAHG